MQAYGEYRIDSKGNTDYVLQASRQDASSVVVNPEYYTNYGRDTLPPGYEYRKYDAKCYGCWSGRAHTVADHDRITRGV